MFIDFAEMQAMEQKVMTMQDWIKKTDQFIKMNDKAVLHASGSKSHEEAVKQAVAEYESFRVKQDKEYISQFDKSLEKYLKGKGQGETEWASIERANALWYSAWSGLAEMFAKSRHLEGEIRQRLGAIGYEF